MTYQLWLSIATMLWQPHVTMIAISYAFSKLAEILTGGILPLILSFIITYLQETSIYSIAATLAVALAALGLAASFLDLRIVDLRQFIKYAFLASVVLSQGPALMADVEATRRDVASAVYERAYSEVGSGEFAHAFSAAPTPAEPWARFDLTDYDPAGYSAFDVALSALQSSPAEAMLPGLPSGFTAVFFPHASITDLDAGTRSDAIQTGWHGVVRLVLAYPLSIVSVVESLMEVIFSAAGMILLTALPFALVFGFFLPTEAILTRLLRQYLLFFLNYVVVSMLIAVGVSGLVAAASRHSLTMMAAGAFLSAVFYFFGMRVAGGALRSSFTAFTSSVAQALNVEAPEEAARRGLGTATGVLGAGVAVAAGAPFLAPAAMQAGQSLTAGGEGGERAKSIARVSLGYLGGTMMHGSGLAGPATAISTMQALGGGQGGMGSMLDDLSAADATMVGLSSQTPWGAALALDRAARRRDRFQRKWSGGERSPSVELGVGPSGPHGSYSDADPGIAMERPGPARQGRVPLRRVPSSWQRYIDPAIARYGDNWAREINAAIGDVVDEFRQAGVSLSELVEHFTDDEGKLALSTAGGRRVFDRLSDETKATLRDPEGRMAIRALIGQEVVAQPVTTRLPPPQERAAWQQSLESAIDQYGDVWADKVAEAIRDAVREMQRDGASPEVVWERFTDADGSPVLWSEGGREVFDRLDAQTQGTLEDPKARKAVQAMVGQHMTSRLQSLAPASLPYRPENALTWREDIQMTIDQYGDDWAAAVSGAIEDTVRQLRQIGVSSEEVPLHFVDDEGELVLSSDGAREIFDRLDPRVQRTFEDPKVRKAAIGMIGREVMPHTEVQRGQIIEAIAEVVGAGRGTRGADAVAERLNVSPAALGSAYGPINSFTKQAQRRGVSGDDIRQASEDPTALPGAMGDQARGLVAMLPDSVRLYQDRVDRNAPAGTRTDVDAVDQALDGEISSSGDGA
jgi:hypothetical protein